MYAKRQKQKKNLIAREMLWALYTVVYSAYTLGSFHESDENYSQTLRIYILYSAGFAVGFGSS